MTNEEIIYIQLETGKVLSINECLNLARSDERAKLSKEIYSLSTEVVLIHGIILRVIDVGELEQILPEKGVEF